MAFHFPLMPRLFMSLRMEDRFPVIDILQQTPDIPETAQWAIFLRNHDELTLEMVTDEERDYMYRAYAADPQMRVNVGIRRRLAPLLQNDRRKIELMNGLLFALPGTPVIYYGDELGMGDNVYLGDRDAVRTPMQWSRDRNAGFSSANPQQLYLPMIIDPEYHYETVNVEAQQQNPSSLLSWMRRIIALRAQHNVFGRGDIEFLLPENAKVLAFTRRHEDEAVLVVANLSRFAQSVNLDLHDHRGMVPVELFGGNEFAPVAEGGYNLTLGPYGFYWFSLQAQHHDALGHAPGPRTCRWSASPRTGASCSAAAAGAAPRSTRAWPGVLPAQPLVRRAHPHAPRRRGARHRAGRRRSGPAGRVRRARAGRVRRRRARDLRRAAHRGGRRRGRADRGRPPQRGAWPGSTWPSGASGCCCSTPPRTTAFLDAAIHQFKRSRIVRLDGGRRAAHLDHARAAPHRRQRHRPHRSPAPRSSRATPRRCSATRS